MEWYDYDDKGGNEVIPIIAVSDAAVACVARNRVCRAEEEEERGQHDD